MASETIKTELVVKHMQVGEGADVGKIKEAILSQQNMSAGARQQLAQGMVPSMPAERALLNELAKIMGVRSSSRMRATGTPQRGRPRTDEAGNPLYDEAGNPLHEMYTPTVEATVRSGPNVHRSQRERDIIRARLHRKTIGRIEDQISSEDMSQAIERAAAEDVTEEELLDINEKVASFNAQKRYNRSAERTTAARTRRSHAMRTLATYDPETGLRSFQKPLTPEEVQKATATVNDAFAYEPDRVEAEYTLKEELRTRRERGRHTREESKYDKKALKDIEQIEKDVEATRKRLDTGKMRERLDAANAKLDRPGLMSMLRDVLSKKPLDFNVPLEGAVPPARRRPGTPLEESEQRFLDQNKALDEKVAAYRNMSREDRRAPAGREALDEIKQERVKVKEGATELEKQQAAEAARMRALESAQLQRRKVVADAVTGSSRELFDADKSILTTGLLGAADKAADMAMLGALATGNPMAILAVGAGKMLTSGLVGGLERGTELQKSAEKIYTQAEPAFAREEQLRAARGRTSVREFSPEAQKRADAANRKLGDPDLPTAGSGTPEDKDVYTNLATKRFKTLQANLGSVMGLQAASEAYQKFRQQSGVIDMSVDDASLAMKTGYMSGMSQDMLARAATVGAVRGNVGGGIRQGLDYRTDIGTLRYQQETLERAGLTGAPADAILNQTLSRQEAMTSMGMRIDFDRDAKFQRVLQERDIAPQQMPGITGGVDDIRMGLMQQLQAPGKEILSGLMMAEAFRQGKTVQGAAAYLAKTSGAKSLEDMQNGVGLGEGLIPLVSTALAPADQENMTGALRDIREGMSAGPAKAVGSGSVDDAARSRGTYEFMSEYSAIGAARGMGDKAKIAKFQSALDGAARAIRSAADSMQGLIANIGSLSD